MGASCRDGVGQGAFRRRLREAASRIIEAEIGDPLALAVVERLIEGPWSTAELVEDIYGSKRDSPGYMTNYTRTRRTLDKLSSRGYVSRSVFGAVKHYRLTQYGFAKLASITSGTPAPKVLLASDTALYTMTLLLAFFLVLSASGRIQLPGSLLTYLSFAFFFVLGLSAARIFRGLRMLL